MMVMIWGCCRVAWQGTNSKNSIYKGGQIESSINEKSIHTFVEYMIAMAVSGYGWLG